MSWTRIFLLNQIRGLLSQLAKRIISGLFFSHFFFLHNSFFFFFFAYVLRIAPCVLLLGANERINKEGNDNGQARPLSSPLLLTVESLMDVSAHGCDFISFDAS